MGSGHLMRSSILAYSPFRLFTQSVSAALLSHPQQSGILFLQLSMPVIDRIPSAVTSRLTTSSKPSWPPSDLPWLLIFDFNYCAQDYKFACLLPKETVGLVMAHNREKLVYISKYDSFAMAEFSDNYLYRITILLLAFIPHKNSEITSHDATEIVFALRYIVFLRVVVWWMLW